jgi:hypothetical protein
MELLLMLVLAASAVKDIVTAAELTAGIQIHTCALEGVPARSRVSVCYGSYLLPWH